jgi:trafficking protein particle complex subunit 11
MNSYPPELLVQLAPVMFVAGLDLPATASTPSTPGTPQDPFVSLISRLRDALASQRKVAIWQPEKAKVFQSILVDRDIRFPPRKLQASEDQSLHSPLSPLTPSSPLHPDGLIAPIWIRKHTTLVPSVFVLFSRIFELPPHNPRSPLDALDPDHERERQLEERRQDTELAAEIALRKRSTNEYNIKLTVVLMASRKMLGLAQAHGAHLSCLDQFSVSR